jgi:hypothetical protein
MHNPTDPRDDGLLLFSGWNLTIRYSKPTTYRAGITDTGGSKIKTVLAGGRAALAGQV